MSRGLRVLGLFLILGCAREKAKPYTSDFDEVNDLAHKIVRRDRAAERTRFVDIVAGHGMEAFTPETLEFMKRHFSGISEAIVESQAPPYWPREDVQAWYRANAWSSRDRRLMVEALRSWLTKPVAAVAQHGSLRVMYSPEEEHGHIVGARIEAARLLADWKAGETLPEVRALRDSLASVAAPSWPNWNPAQTLAEAESLLQRPRPVP